MTLRKLYLIVREYQESHGIKKKKKEELNLDTNDICAGVHGSKITSVVIRNALCYRRYFYAFNSALKFE